MEHNSEEVHMSEKQKISLISAVVAVSLSIVTLIFTVAAVPYKAGSVMERLIACEEKVEKVDEIAEDVSYIRGWIDSQTKGR